MPPRVKTFELDPNYNLTLVVGSHVPYSYEHARGQKKFRVNANTLKLASGVWDAMFHGKASKSKPEEMSFPDDCSNAFHMVLQIAHFKSQDLPRFISEKDFITLVKLCKKYDIVNIVHPHVLAKGWSLYKNEYGFWNHDLDTNDTIMVAQTFKMEKDLQVLIRRLVMNAAEDSKGKLCHIIRGEYLSKVEFEDEAIIDKVRKLRQKILDDIIPQCQRSYADLLCLKNCSRRKQDIHAAKLGRITLSFHDAGLSPTAPASEYRDSVSILWREFRVEDDSSQTPEKKVSQKPNEKEGKIPTCSETCTSEKDIQDIFRNAIEKTFSQKFAEEWEKYGLRYIHPVY